MADYDIITVGGGIAGTALGKAMAERGHRVLICEGTTEFKDRVRGEFIQTWGVAEAKELGVLDAMLEAGGREVPMMQNQAGPAPLPLRNLPESTPLGLSAVCIYHPAMQEAVLQAAIGAGAGARRGARVTGVKPGAEPSVEVDGERLSARLVVGADGRSSSVRKWGAFEVEEDAPEQVLTGVLFENMKIDSKVSVLVYNFMLGQNALLFPQGSGKVRGYFGCRSESGVRLAGEKDFAKFVEECIRTGVPAEVYEGATQGGPLATFDGYDSWVAHPYKNGVALVGDAAATSDQTWGQGIAIALRHARTLSEALLANDDWQAAGNAYAVSACKMFEEIRRVESWFTELLMDTSEEANAFRMKALPQIAADPAALPDTMIAGPDHAPADDAALARLLGD